MEFRGSIVEVIRNDRNLYDGDLTHYFRALFFHGQNLRHPYHNLRHMLHVLWLCYQAVLYYILQIGVPLTRRQMRNLFIGAMFHDFDHSGQFGNDDLNIERAVRGLRKHIHPMDEEHIEDIIAIIRTTEYPPKEDSANISLPAQILRDADVSQAMSVAWIQQVIIGLSQEWGKSPLEVLRMQGVFHRNLKFSTAWGNALFPREVIEAKIKESEELLGMLEEPKTA